MPSFSFSADVFPRGIIVALDLDAFRACTKAMNWTRWTPNPITDLITSRVRELVTREHCLVLWGLNEREGTEEAVLVFLHTDAPTVKQTMERFVRDIATLAQEIEAPTTLSIGMAVGPITELKPLTNNRKQTLQRCYTRWLAYQALKEAKRRGGNCLVSY